MSQTDDGLITVLDIGSSRTRVLVAELHEGALRYRGHAQVRSQGMRKGLVAELGPAIRAVTHAANEAEQVAQVELIVERRPREQRQTLIGLRLNKIGRRSTLEDTPAVRGMVAKVAHLVRVVDGQ